jgi:TP901 family phage tail tape measure protein
MAVYVPIVSTFDARGIDKAVKDFKKLEGGANKTAYGLRTLDSAARNMAKAVAKIGGITAIFGGIAVKQFMNFDQAMTQSIAIMGDVSDSMRKEMSDAARQMAKETTFSAEEAAQSYFYLASAGLNAEQSVAALPKVAKFAQAGMFDMALATDLLTDAQSALGLTIRTDTVKNIQNMARVSDVLVKANTLANATVEQFSKSLTTKAGAALRTVNKDIEEGVAVLASFADQGIKGEEAGTQFSIVMRDLQTRALKNAEAFRRANIEVYDQTGTMNNLGKIIQQIEKRLTGMTDAQKRAEFATLGFTDKSISALLALVGTSDAIMNYEKELRNASGTTEEIAAKQLTSLSAQLQLARSYFQDLAISLGEKLAPVVRDITLTFQNFASIVGERGVGEGVTYLIGKTVTGISSMGAWGKAIFIVVGAFAALRIATVTYTATFAVLNAAVSAFNLTLNATKVALVAAGGVTALLGIAGAAYAIYAGQKAKAIQSTNDFRAALKLEGEAQDDAIQALYESDKGYRMSIDALNIFGYSLKDVSEFINTGRCSLSKLNFEYVKSKGATDLINESTEEMRKALGLSESATKDQTIAFFNLTLMLAGHRDAALKSADASLQVARASGDARQRLIANYDQIIATGGKLNAAQQSFYNAAKKALNGVADEAEDAEDEISSSFGNVGKTLKTAADRFKTFLSALKGFGSSQKTYASALKSTEKANKDLTKATKDLTKAQEDFDKVVKGYGAGSKEATEAQADLEQAQRDAIRAGFDVERRTQAITEAEKELARVMSDPLATVEERREAERALSEARLELTESEIAFKEATDLITTSQTILNEIINGATEGSTAYKDAQDKLTESQDKYAEAVDRVAEAIDREAEAKARLAESERQLRSARGEVTQEQVARAEKQTGIKSVGKKKKKAAKAKAVGGSVMAGQPYIVGERGRELFMPSQSGSIVPNNRMPQGDTYNIVINSKIADEALPDLIVAELRKFNRRSGAIKIQVA